MLEREIKKNLQVDKKHKTLRYLLWTIFGIILMIGGVFATTVITDSGTSTFGSNVDTGDNNLTTANMFFGNTYGKFNETCPNRPFTTNEERTITVGVGKDYETIQEAVCQTPFLLRHKFTINVDAGTYDEDIYIPAIIGSGLNTGGSEGSVIMFTLNGDTMANTKIKSLQITSHIGAWVSYIRDFEVYGQEPTSDEGVSVSVYGSNSVLLSHLNMTNNSVYFPIMFYSSSGGAHTINFDNTEGGFYIKGDSQVYLGDWYSDAKLSGLIEDGSFILLGKGCMATLENNQVTGYDDLVNCHGGELYEYDNATGYTTSHCGGSVGADSSFVPGTQSGLVLGMNFNQDSIYNNKSLDNSDNNINGTTYGDVYFENDTYNGWAEFDGRADYIDLNEEEKLNISDDITFMAWIKLKQETGFTNPKYIFWAEDDSPSMKVDTAGALTFNAKDLSTWNILTYPNFNNTYYNEWVHVAGTFDKDDQIILYVNGDKVKSKNMDGEILERKLSVRIGQDDIQARSWNGSIDDVRVYNRVLMPLEIRSIAENRNIQIKAPTLKKVNPTIYGKLTFALGELIENVVDGWLKITGNLEVTGNLTVGGTLDLGETEITASSVTAGQINSVLYVQAGNYSDFRVKTALCSDFCHIVVPKGIYQVSGDSIPLRANTIFEGNDAILNMTEDTNTFVILEDTGNITIKGFRFIDENKYLTTGMFIRGRAYNISKMEIYDNYFYGINGTTAISLGNEPTGDFARDVKIYNNVFEEVKSGVNYEGYDLQFLNNYLSHGNMPSVTESEGLDYNFGEGGVISGNIIDGFSEQGLDINADRVTISNNVVYMRSDGLTTHGIGSMGNENGVVIGNIVYLDGESNSIGIDIRNNDDGGQTVIGNNIKGVGVGKGIWVEISNYSTVTGNTISNVTDGIYIDGSFTNLGVNNFYNVSTKVNDNGVDNGFKFSSPLKSSLNSTIFKIDSTGTANITTYYPISFEVDSAGMQIKQSSTLGGATPYGTAEFPILDLRRESSSRGVTVRLGNTAGGIFLYADNNGFSFKNITEDEIFKMDKNGNLNIGDGSTQINITLTSPDGTEFTCGVNDSGSFLCS